VNKLSGVLLVFTILLASCSSGGDAEALADALAKDIQDDSDNSELLITDEESVCIGESLVDSIGVERFKDMGITAEDISGFDDAEITDDEEKQIAQSMVQCIGGKEFFDRAFSASGMPEETVDCLLNEFTDEQIDELALEMNSDSADAPKAFEDAVQKCIS